MLIQYTGPDAMAVVTAAQFAAAGFPSVSTKVFRRENDYVLNLPPAAAVWLDGQPNYQAIGDAHPVAEYEVGYVENASGVVQAVTAPIFNVTGLIMVVPPQERPLWIEAALCLDVQTAPGAGNTTNFDGYIMDEADAYWGQGSVNISGANGVQGNPSLLIKGRVGPTAVEKTFRVVMVKTGSVVGAANIYHGAIVASAFKSWMTAFVR